MKYFYYTTSYNKENVQLKQQVESLQNIDEIRRGGAE